MPLLRTQVRLNAASGVPEDASVNTFHFRSAVSTTPYALIANALTTFYSTLRPLIPAAVPSTGGLTYRIYDLADPTPRAPVYEATANITGTAPSYAMPREVALCLSFQATRLSGVSQARRRGRVYIGPIGFGTASNIDVPTATQVNYLYTAATALLAASTASADWTWVIHSEAGGNDVNVDGGWVDNAWDTQRRRGLTPSTRTVFP